jgi:O-antigen ligase
LVKTSRGALPLPAIGVVVVFLGTINLWKIDSLQSLFSFDLTLASAVLAAAVTSFALISRVLSVDRSWAPLLIGFGLFTPALFATSLGNPYSLTKTQTLFSLCLLSAATPMVLLRSEPARLWFLRVLGALSLVLAFWLLKYGAVLAGTDTGRLQIESVNPIAVGRMACLGFVIFGLIVLHRHGLSQLAALAGFVVCAVAAVSTGSRGPLAAAVAAVALVYVLSGSDRSRGKTVVTLAVFAVGAWQAVTQFAPTSALERISTAGGGASDTERIRLATESLTIAWNNLGGVGWGDLGDYLSAAARSDVQGWAQYPHNVILEALVEGGVLGLMGLLIMLWVSWRRLRANASGLNAEIMQGLWLFALGSAMTSGDLIGNRLVWMMIGVGLALPSTVRVPQAVGRSQLALEGFGRGVVADLESGKALLDHVGVREVVGRERFSLVIEK